MVVDISTGTPVAFIESLKSLRTEKFSLPYPFLLKVSQPKVEEMKVDSCVESEEQYVIKITVNTFIALPFHCSQRLGNSPSERSFLVGESYELHIVEPQSNCNKTFFQ